MRRSILRVIVFSAVATVPAIAQISKGPVIAFVIGTTLTLANSSGKVLQEIRLGRPVHNFALSKDRKLLVTVAQDTETGGNLSLFDLKTHVRSKLTDGHLYFKSKDLDKGETEVYDDPQFSPDGRSLAFAIHTDNPGDGNDAINDSGPIAVMDLRTRKVRVLKSTENIEGQGFCFANTPMWSPDGKWILFNCENGAFITDSAGTTLRPLKIGTEERPMTSAVSWVGNSCVLYLQGADGPPHAPRVSDEARLLSLRTSESQNAAILLTFPLETLDGMIEASESAVIRRKAWDGGNSSSVETKETEWQFPSPATAHTLGGWSYAAIPQGCD